MDGDQQALEIGRFLIVERVAVSPDGKFGLLLRHVSRMPPLTPVQTLQLLQLTSDQAVRTLENIPNPIREVSFLGDANRALSIGTDRT